MRSIKKSWLLISFFLILLVGNPYATSAQPPDPPTDCDPNDPDPGPDDPCIPIDGGLAFLLAAGVGYGVVKNRTVLKNKQMNAADSQKK